MKSKKAFEIQFNWIFVLIAGAAILIFFTSIIIKQKSITQSSINIDILKQMENIISGASVSADTIVPLEIPNIEIKVSCNKISIGQSAAQYQNLILFSPAPIKGDKIVTQTLPFKEPYKSANLLFITSAQAKYILIGGDPLFREVNKTIPAELDKEDFALYDTSRIRDANNYKVKLVFFNSNLPSRIPDAFRNKPDSDVAAIKVTGNIEKGTITFYKKNGEALSSTGNFAYAGKSSIIAAIYSENPELYECNMRNVFSKNRIVTQIYKSKTQEMITRFMTGSTTTSSTRPECRQIYTNALTYLNILETSSSALAQPTGITESNIDALLRASGSLDTQNIEAQRFSCPVIY